MNEMKWNALESVSNAILEHGTRGRRKNTNNLEWDRVMNFENIFSHGFFSTRPLLFILAINCRRLKISHLEWLLLFICLKSARQGQRAREREIILELMGE
jgi:hypothetical protein